LAVDTYSTDSIVPVHTENQTGDTVAADIVAADIVAADAAVVDTAVEVVHIVGQRRVVLGILEVDTAIVAGHMDQLKGR
jgi:hypothetical protein